MTEKLKQIIKDELVKLPQEAQKAISTFDWAKMTEEIGEKYLLNESEVNNFQVETLLVLVGLERGDSYARNIENNVGTSKDEAGKIADETYEKIFSPIFNIIEESIKKNLKSKNPNWKQSIGFILSGGDYSVFMEQRSESNNSDNQKTILPVFPIRK